MRRIYAAITLDEGYLEQCKAAEALSRKGIEATFFLITHLKSYNGKALLATKPELIRKIHRMGHEIASHTRTHPLLTKVPKETVEEECSTSRDYLSEIIGDEVEGFAYPYGSYNDKVIDVVRKYYRYARIMGEFNRWNIESRNPYTIGGMGIRHLIKLPGNLFVKNNIETLVLVFHTESLITIANTIRLLNPIGVRFVTLRELVEDVLTENVDLT